MPAIPVTVSFVALYTLALFILAARIGLRRRSMRALHGDKEDSTLYKRIRIYGNLTEIAPAFGMTLFVAEYLGLASFWLWSTLIIFLLGRILHYIHFDSPKRGLGMILTLIPGPLLGLWSLYASVFG
ncbi:MAG: MAPEG family protein [Cohaesibacter sp.]|nr:MAPEG family protein [Cohaesibacter sp.]